MASIVGSSVSFKASPRALLNSSIASKNYGPKPSVSFWRSDAPKMPSLSVTCAAKQETVDEVIKIVRTQLAVEKDTAVTGETKFAELGADSLDTVEIVMELESNFGITVNEDSAADIATINDAAEMIEELTKLKTA